MWNLLLKQQKLSHIGGKNRSFLQNFLDFAKKVSQPMQKSAGWRKKNCKN